MNSSPSPGRALGAVFRRVVPGGRVFVAVKPSAGGGSVKKSVVTDRTFGTGDGLDVTDAEGNRVAVMLFPRLPFILFRSTLHNRANELKTIRTVRTVSAALDLDRPPAELRTLGTGGLLAADKNPGSYAWLAVADPVTRRGVVGGWLTHDRGSGVVRSTSKAGM